MQHDDMTLVDSPVLMTNTSTAGRLNLE